MGPGQPPGAFGNVPGPGFPGPAFGGPAAAPPGFGPPGAFPGGPNPGLGPAIANPMLGANAAPLGSSGGARARSGEKSLPIVMWGAGGAAVLLVVATLMFMVGRGSSPNPQPVALANGKPATTPEPRRSESPRTTSHTPREPTSQPTDPAMMAGVEQPAITPPSPASPSGSSTRPSPPRIESPEDIYKLAKCSVVKIDVFSDTFNPRTGLGSGFIIDTERRFIATNYHVVSDAAKADIVFDDGTRFDIEGYVLVEPEMDLAVLKAKGLPPYAQALQLASDLDPNPGSQVYSIGHPKDYKLTMRSGLISSVANTEELPEDAQLFLKAEGTTRKDNRWIQHEAEIFGGNSGGPLLNQHGLVLGINTWKDESINGHFALHSKALAQLLKRPIERVEPLTKYRQRETTPIDKLARLFDMETIRSLFTRLELNNWSPQSREDYEGYSILAVALTMMSMAEFDAEDPRTQAWLAQLKEFYAKLKKENWHQNSDRSKKLNTYAQGVLEEATTGHGVLMVMRVGQTVVGPGVYMMHGHVDGRRVMVRLLNLEQRLPPTGYFLVPGVIVGTAVMYNEEATVVVTAEPIFIGSPTSPPRPDSRPQTQPPRTEPRPPMRNQPRPRLSPPQPQPSR